MIDIIDRDVCGNLQQPAKSNKFETKNCVFGGMVLEMCPLAGCTCLCRDRQWWPKIRRWLIIGRFDSGKEKIGAQYFSPSWIKADRVVKASSELQMWRRNPTFHSKGCTQMTRITGRSVKQDKEEQTMKAWQQRTRLSSV